MNQRPLQITPRTRFIFVPATLKITQPKLNINAASISRGNYLLLHQKRNWRLQRNRAPSFQSCSLPVPRCDWTVLRTLSLDQVFAVDGRQLSGFQTF